MLQLSEAAAATLSSMRARENRLLLPPSHAASRSLNPPYWKCRAVLIEWLLDICKMLHLSKTSLHAAVSHLDRFMLRRRVKSTEVWPVLGMACILIAAKMEESSVDVQDLMEALCIVLEEQNMNKTLCQAESCIISTLDWDLSVQTAAHFLVFYDFEADTFAAGSTGLSADDVEEKRRVAAQLIDVGSREYNLVERFLPSRIASAAVSLATRFVESGGFLMDSFSSSQERSGQDQIGNIHGDQGICHRIVRGVFDEDATLCADLLAKAYNKVYGQEDGLTLSPRSVRNTACESLGRNG